MNKAFILAGGLGTRLRPAIPDVPKPIAPVAGQPFITYPIRWLRRQGITDITLCLGHRASAIMQVLGDGELLGVRISYSVESKPLGTGGSLKLALGSHTAPVIVANGDTYFELDSTSLLTVHEALGEWVTLALKKARPGQAGGYVEVGLDGLIRTFVEKPSKLSSEALISAGVYVFGQKAISMLPDSSFSLERDFFPTLASAGHLAAYVTEGYFADIGTPESWQQFERDVLEGKVNAHSK